MRGCGGDLDLAVRDCLLQEVKYELACNGPATLQTSHNEYAFLSVTASLWSAPTPTGRVTRQLTHSPHGARHRRRFAAKGGHCHLAVTATDGVKAPLMTELRHPLHYHINLYFEKRSRSPSPFFSFATTPQLRRVSARCLSIERRA